MGRPKGIRPSAVEKASGYGRIGYCKICSHPGAQFLNAMIVREEAKGTKVTSTLMQSYMAMLDPEFRADRHTYYAHVKEHLTSPLVTAAENARANAPKILPKTNREGLEMIRDLGLQNAMDHPEIITPDHAIKAIDTMEKKSNGPETLWVLLSQAQAGQLPPPPQPDLIEGEFLQIETKEAQPA